MIFLAMAGLALSPGACGGSDGASPDGADGGVDTALKQDCGSLGKSQGISQPCCLAFGVDACGAGLFCAAFDGRTQPTCYVEGSRKDRQACFEDRHCASGQCNVARKQCRSMPGTSCEKAVGCANDPQGGSYFCSAKDGVCRKPGNGQSGSVCGDNAQCDSGYCVDERCAPALMEPCLAPDSAAHCAPGLVCGMGVCTYACSGETDPVCQQHAPAGRQGICLGDLGGKDGFCTIRCDSSHPCPGEVLRCRAFTIGAEMVEVCVPL